jgi:hypothetical protein
MSKHKLAVLIATTAASVLAFAIVPAQADCVCQCVNGQMEPICENTFDLRPICPPTICGIVPPSIRPIDPPMIPPIGTSSCGPEQVENPDTGQYEWRTICH